MYLPRIETVFDPSSRSYSQTLYSEMIHNALQHMLMSRMTFVREETLRSDPDIRADQHDQLIAMLPLLSVKLCGDLPGDVSFYALSKFRSNSFKFFFDMLGNCLLPGRGIHLVLLYAADFRMPDIGDQVFTLSQVIIRVEKESDLEIIKRNYSILESELKLGIPSNRYARRILEIKGLLNDEKTVIIQEYLASLINRWPEAFDHDLLTEMQHVLVMCSEDFKSSRESRQLSRIICLLYRFRKALGEAVKKAPKKRALNIKLFKAQLKTEQGSKVVLAVLVGMNFFQDKEVFDKTHLLKAIQNYIPEAQAVEDSFFTNRRGADHIVTLYLEIEKSNGQEFTQAEIVLLRQELSSDLKDRIEHLMHPVFMPRNEEEIMRNILSLSSEIKYLRDIPQVFISFDEQTHASLFFTVILVRILKPGSKPIQEMFKNENSFLEYSHDRCQYAGTVRKKYKKEATVFRLKLSKDRFLRADHSIHLNKARQVVTSELFRVVGEIRDFNGGMISKQNEVLCELIGLLQDIKYNDLLLENFFYSLTPVIMRNVLDPSTLHTLFLMLLDSLDQRLVNGESYLFQPKIETEFVFVMIKTEDRTIREEVNRALSKLQFHSSQIASSYVSVYDLIYKGYIYRSDDPASQQLFCRTIQNALTNAEARKRAVVTVSR